MTLKTKNSDIKMLGLKCKLYFHMVMHVVL
jgi:hypothetical protein